LVDHVFPPPHPFGWQRLRLLSLPARGPNLFSVLFRGFLLNSALFPRPPPPPLFRPFFPSLFPSFGTPVFSRCFLPIQRTSCISPFFQLFLWPRSIVSSYSFPGQGRIVAGVRPKKRRRTHPPFSVPLSFNPLSIGIPPSPPADWQELQFRFFSFEPGTISCQFPNRLTGRSFFPPCF